MFPFICYFSTFNCMGENIIKLLYAYYRMKKVARYFAYVIFPPRFKNFHSVKKQKKKK